MSSTTLSPTPTASPKRRKRLTMPDVASLVLVIGIACGFAPLLVLHLKRLWSVPHYQFFPLVLVASGILIWRRWPPKEAQSAVSSWLRIPCFLVSFMLLLAGVLLFSPWVAATGAVFAVAAVLLQLTGRAFWKSLFSAWLLLWLIVPPPFGLDVRLIEWLQTFTSRAASSILDQLGVMHLLSGNVIEFPDQSLFVEEACSGIQSLFALIACAALLVVWTRRHVIPAVLLVASAVFWAGLGNVIRVTVVAAALAWWDIDLSTGWQHEALGIVLFVAAFAMLMSTERFLHLNFAILGAMGIRVGNARRKWRQKRRKRRRHFAGSRSRSGDQQEARSRRFGRRRPNPPKTGSQETGSPRPNAQETNPPPVRAPQMAIWRSGAVAGVFGCLAGLQLWILAAPPINKVRLKEAAAALDKSALPKEKNGWMLVDYVAEERELRSEFGQHSKVWSYQAPFCRATVSFDYPFEGWHEVTRCYRSHGWNVEGRTVVPDPNGSSLVQVELTKRTGEHGYLLFVNLDESGRPVEPPKTGLSFTSKLYAKVVRSPVFQLLKENKLADPDTDAATYQVQTFVPTEAPLSDAQQNKVRKQFLEFQREFSNQWK